MSLVVAKASKVAFAFGTFGLLAFHTCVGPYPQPPSPRDPSYLQFLEPEEGVWADYGEPDPYSTRVAELLLSEHAYRKCQMVFMPSFRSESVVYIVRNDDSESEALAVVKELRPQLYYALTKELRREAEGELISWSPQSQRRALKSIQVEAVSSTALLDRATVELLGDVWTEMLTEVRHRTDTLGDDGISYHVAHYVDGLGYRSGKTWSPSDPGSLSDFVSIAEALRAFVLAKEHTRDAAKLRLQELAIELREKLWIDPSQQSNSQLTDGFGRTWLLAFGNVSGMMERETIGWRRRHAGQRPRS
jgi:hypothetical protein